MSQTVPVASELKKVHTAQIQPAAALAIDEKKKSEKVLFFSLAVMSGRVMLLPLLLLAPLVACQVVFSLDPPGQEAERGFAA
jgi:hypothetical protein